MNDDVKNILNNLLGSKHIDAMIVYKFLKGNVADIDALLEIVDSLLNECKINGSQAFVLTEYLSTLKIDITINPCDVAPYNPNWWHPYVTEPIYVKTTPDTSPIWNGNYTVSAQPTSNYFANNNTYCKNHNKQ